MKIQISKNILENLLIYTSPFIEKKDASQITSHIYFEVTPPNTLSINATDNQFGLNIKTDQIKVDVPGIATANGKKFLDIVRILKDESIDLETKDNMLIIKQNHSLFKLPMFNAQEYPKFPSIQDKSKVDIDSQLLISSLKKITPAIDTNNPKFELNGALIKFSENMISFASTDTRRLAVVEIENVNTKELSLIIPKKAIEQIQKLFNNNISIYYNETHLMIESEQFSFFTKLINGNFPEFSRIIPQTTNINMRLNKNKIIEAIKQITTISNEIQITFNPDTIYFESLNDDNIKATTDIEYKTNIDQSISIAIHSKYLLDFLSQIDTQEFSIGLNESNLPFLLQENNFKTVVMPIII